MTPGDRKGSPGSQGPVDSAPPQGAMRRPTYEHHPRNTKDSDVTTSSHPDPETNPSAAVQPHRPPATAVGRAPDVDGLWRTCVALAKADILPPAVVGNPGNIFAVAMLGQQFGMQAVPAALNIHVIQSGSGRKSFALAANLWVALARKAGHKVVKGEHTATACTVYLWRADDPDTRHEATYTIDDAERAGLLRNDNYKKNPKAMLYARAASTVVREAAGEVAMGFLDTFEAEAMTAEHGPPRAANLAEAAAKRTGPPQAKADYGITDAEIVDNLTAEETVQPPSAEQLADLERRHAAPDGGVVPTPGSVDTTPIAEGDDPADDACPGCGDSFGHTPECPLATDPPAPEPEPEPEPEPGEALWPDPVKPGSGPRKGRKQ